MDRIIVRTNWTNTVQKVHAFMLDDLRDAKTRDLLRACFLDPESLRPAKTRQKLTEEAAQAFASLAQRLRERGNDPETVAHFVNRLVFCMFAEDVALLPNKMFQRMLEHCQKTPQDFVDHARTLFSAMQKGGIDKETLEVRAVEVTSSNIGDAPMLPELVNQIPPDQDIESVNADGAYDTRKCHNAIAARNAHAVIPPRKNAKPWKPTSAGAIARNEAVNASRYLGRALWRRWSGYHRRRRVESKMNCIKLLGQSLMARDFDCQVAEIQIRIAVLNRYTALGIPTTKPAG